MYAVMEMRTNEQGIMTDELKMETPNPVYAQNKISTGVDWMGSANILSTILFRGENPIPQREPQDDNKSESGILTED